MPSGETTVIRSLAVTAEDVVAAPEANRTRSDAAVLRGAPPFSGCMRARLNSADVAADADPEALHVPPERFVDSPPPVPSPEEPEDAVRADPAATYDPQNHLVRHAAAPPGLARRRPGRAGRSNHHRDAGRPQEVTVSAPG